MVEQTQHPMIDTNIHTALLRYMQLYTLLSDSVHILGMDMYVLCVCVYKLILG